MYLNQLVILFSMNHFTADSDSFKKSSALFTAAENVVICKVVKL